MMRRGDAQLPYNSVSNVLSQCAKGLMTSFLSANIILSSSSLVNANVGEGGLPEGALAFSKVQKFQADWKTVANSVKERGDKMDTKEILNIKAFLKQLANEYYDLDLLTQSISDPVKVNQAKSLAKEFRVKIRECDDSATAGSLQKINENYPVTNKLLNDFLVLLQDVPDEL
eukprot:CAMPEP_0182425110 /NCGR_PEP_ID=MMETSP1167-20130531/11439_1 /TAXON_ID=2988 /ORGANISM="Mallomonas Sp, Strain CCMP3275" /LENGTH=171 /DNA_ID=CAMNT_0024605475 /DNA_START=126 /DNA_END=641 /DNA_ORIENTATION=-